MSAEPDNAYDPRMIERYMDFRLFVDDALTAMGVSRGRFADAVKMSRSMMSHMLNFTRRMNPTYVGAMADFFRLDTLGRSLLAAMIDLDNESARARRSAWATLQAHQRYLSANRPDLETMKVLSTWWMAAIYELASTAAFRADPRWIAATLVPRIDEDRAQGALQALLAAGMLVPDQEGRLRPVSELQWTESVVSDSELSRAIWSLQRSLLGLAVEAPHRFSTGDRHQSGSVMAIPRSKLEGVITRLRELEREVFHLATSVSEDSPDRVYALSINFIPLTGFSSETELPGESTNDQ